MHYIQLDVALQVTLLVALLAILPSEEATVALPILQTEVGVVLTLLTIRGGGLTLHITPGGGLTLHSIAGTGPILDMIDTGHILDLALRLAGHLSACMTDHTLPMKYDMTRRMRTPTEGTVTDLFHEVPRLMILIMEGTVTGLFLGVPHPGQGEGQGGATHGVLHLFQREATHEMCPPGQGGAIQEALRGVANVRNATQEARV